MATVCKNVCQTDKRFGISSRYYAKGTKYCSHCAKKIAIEDLRCPCCRSILRVRTRSWKAKSSSRNAKREVKRI